MMVDAWNGPSFIFHQHTPTHSGQKEKTKKSHCVSSYVLVVKEGRSTRKRLQQYSLLRYHSPVCVNSREIKEARTQVSDNVKERFAAYRFPWPCLRVFHSRPFCIRGNERRHGSTLLSSLVPVSLTETVVSLVFLLPFL